MTPPREAQIWSYRDLDHLPLSDDFANVAVLNDEFYQAITEHSIATGLEAA